LSGCGGHVLAPLQRTAVGPNGHEGGEERQVIEVQRRALRVAVGFKNTNDEKKQQQVEQDHVFMLLMVCKQSLYKW
jgi:hypothetical protein